MINVLHTTCIYKYIFLISSNLFEYFPAYIPISLYTYLGIREWFRWYKTPDSKPLNRFGYDEQALPRKHALEVIEETHLHWKHLREGKVKAGNLWFQE